MKIEDSDLQSFRTLLDLQYHGHYTEDRQIVQNTIIRDILDKSVSRSDRMELIQPCDQWLIMTAGPMGSGKSTVIEWLKRNSLLPCDSSLVQVDMDEIRLMLPEGPYLKENRPAEFGYITQKESGYIAEVCIHAAITHGRSLVIDGSMRNKTWQLNFIRQLKKIYPVIRILLLHITAPENVIQSRVEARCADRMVPRDILEESLQLSSIEAFYDFAHDVDCLVGVDNAGDGDDGNVAPKLVYPWHMSWDDFKCTLKHSKKRASGGGSDTSSSVDSNVLTSSTVETVVLDASTTAGNLPFSAAEDGEWSKEEKETKEVEKFPDTPLPPLKYIEHDQAADFESMLNNSSSFQQQQRLAVEDPVDVLLRPNAVQKHLQAHRPRVVAAAAYGGGRFPVAEKSFQLQLRNSRSRRLQSEQRSSSSSAAEVPHADLQLVTDSQVLLTSSDTLNWQMDGAEEDKEDEEIEDEAEAQTTCSSTGACGNFISDSSYRSGRLFNSDIPSIHGRHHTTTAAAVAVAATTTVDSTATTHNGSFHIAQSAEEECSHGNGSGDACGGHEAKTQYDVNAQSTFRCMEQFNAIVAPLDEQLLPAPVPGQSYWFDPSRMEGDNVIAVDATLEAVSGFLFRLETDIRQLRVDIAAAKSLPIPPRKSTATNVDTRTSGAAGSTVRRCSSHLHQAICPHARKTRSYLPPQESLSSSSSSSSMELATSSSSIGANEEGVDDLFNDEDGMISMPTTPNASMCNCSMCVSPASVHCVDDIRTPSTSSSLSCSCSYRKSLPSSANSQQLQYSGLRSKMKGSTHTGAHAFFPFPAGVGEVRSTTDPDAATTTAVAEEEEEEEDDDDDDDDDDDNDDDDDAAAASNPMTSTRGAKKSTGSVAACDSVRSIASTCIATAAVVKCHLCAMDGIKNRPSCPVQLQNRNQNHNQQEHL